MTPDELRDRVDRRKVDRDVPPDVENLLDDLLDALRETWAERDAWREAVETHRASRDASDIRAAEANRRNRLTIERNAEILAENERLARWKAEAATVLSTWEAVWEALGKPGALGDSKAAAALAEVERLRARVRNLERMRGERAARVALDRVRALCDDAEIAVDQGRAQGHVCGPDCHCDCLAVEDVRAAADTTRPLDGEGDDQ